MASFDWEYLEDKDIILLKNIPCEGLVNEYNLLKEKLDDPEETQFAKRSGATTPEGVPLKKNSGIFLSQVYMPEYAFISPAGGLFGEIYTKLKTHSFPVKSVMNSFKATSGFDVLISRYDTGNYYKPHRDQTTLTMLVWPLEKKYKGGDLFFPDLLNFKLSCDAGTGVIFPGHYIHGVEEVFSENKDDVRVTFTGFVN